MKTKIFAHRGNAILEPENTMDAFQSALDLNVEGIELDIHKTQDDKIIVTHDENLQRVTNVDLNIKDVSYDRIKSLNAAAFMNNGRNSYVPLLAEVLDLVKEKDIIINIELKILRFCTLSWKKMFWLWFANSIWKKESFFRLSIIILS